MGEMMELDRTGDTRIQFDKSNAVEVSAAEKRFKELKGKGYAAFGVNKKGDKGVLMSDFDPAAERILFVPPLVGG
jgi:hypothetical protein